jgi:transcriptional regulator with XRE-family HTH domain
MEHGCAIDRRYLVVDRICAGENALRVVREWRGKTQLYIAQKANIGQGYISDLESGRRKGTIAALKRIADALKVPLDLIAQGMARVVASQLDLRVQKIAMRSALGFDLFARRTCQEGRTG